MADIGLVEGTLKMRVDEFSGALDKAASQLKHFEAAPKAAVMAVSDLEKQLKKLASTPSMRADAASSAKSLANVKAETRALEEQVAVLKRGPAAVAALNREREVMNRLLATGVSRESAYGKQIEEQIRKHQRYREEVRKLSDTTQTFGARTQAVGQKMTALGGQLTASVTVPLAAASGFLVKSASDFESSFAGVRKTVDATEMQFASLAAGMRELAKTIPVNVNELNKIGESAGQLGIKTENILDFTNTVAALGVTTNLSADAAATSLARLANITGLAQDKFSNIGSAIVGLGNNFATTESEILEFGLRIAAAGDIAGLTESQILGVSAAMSSVGVEAEAGGTAVQKVLLGMTQAVAQGNKDLAIFAKTAGMSAAEFSKAFKEDAGGAFQAFVEGLGVQGKSAFNTLETLKLEDQRLIKAFLSLSNAGDLLSRSVALSTAEFAANTALAKEAEQRYNTFASQLQLFWNEVRDAAITLGQSLLPVLRDVLTAVKPAIDFFARFALAFADLPKPIRAAGLGLVALLAAMGPIMYVGGNMVLLFGQLSAAAQTFALRMGATAGAIGLVVVALTTAVMWSEKLKQSLDREIESIVKANNAHGERVKVLRQVQEAVAAGGTPLITEAQAKMLQAGLEASRKKAAELRAELEKLKAIQDPRTQSITDQSITRVSSALQVAEREAKKFANALLVSRPAAEAAAAGADVFNSKIDNLITSTKEASKAGQEWAEHIYEQQRALEGKQWEDHVTALQQMEDALDDAIKKERERAEAVRAYNAARQAAGIVDLAKLREEVGWEEKRVAAMKDGAKGLRDWAVAKQVADYAARTNATPAMIKEFERLLKLLGLLKGQVDDYAEAVKQIKENFVRGVQTAMADFFMQVLEGGGNAFKNFGKALKQLLFKTLAEYLAQWLITQAKMLVASLKRIAVEAAAQKAANSGGSGGGGGMNMGSFANMFKGASGGASAGAMGGGASAGGGVTGGAISGGGTGAVAGTSSTTATGAAAGAGAAAAAVIVIAAFAAYRKSLKDARYKKTYGTRANLSMAGGELSDNWMGALDQTGPRAAQLLRDTFQGMSDAIGVGLKGMQDVSIKIRNDKKYFDAMVGGEVIGRFNSLEEATIAAAKKVFTSGKMAAALDPLMEAVIKGFQGKDPQKLAEAVTLTRQVQDTFFGVTAMERSILSARQQIESFTHSLVELGMRAGEARQVGMMNAVNTFRDLWAQLSGKQMSPQEQQANAERSKKLLILQVTLYMAELRAKAEHLKSSIRIMQMEFGAGRNNLLAEGALASAEAELNGDILMAGKEYLKGRAQLAGQNVDLMNAELQAIAAILEELDKLIAEISIGKIRIGGIGGGGGRGGGGGDAQSFRDMWKEALKALRDWAKGLKLSQLSPLTPVQRLREAQAQVAAAMAAISGGGQRGLAALQNLPQLLEALLSEAGGVFGTSTAGYQQIFAQIQALVAQVLGGDLPENIRAQIEALFGGGSSGTGPASNSNTGVGQRVRVDFDPVTMRLDTANSHLAAIKTHTSRTANGVDELVRTNRSRTPAR